MTTSLLLLLLPILVLGAATPRGVEENLVLDNGLDRGDWGFPDICPAGSWAFAFEIKYADIGYIDDTCMNAIRMYCRDSTGTLTGNTISTEGQYGEWQGMRTCSGTAFLKGLRANVVEDMGTFGDDLGMDNLQMQCSDNVILDGRYGSKSDEETIPVSRDMIKIGDREVERVHYKINRSDMTRDYGDWGAWMYCSEGNKICGHESRVEPESTINDDAGLVDVIMFCCSY